MASPAPARAALWLKVLVIAMGLLIVAGFIFIAAEIGRRVLVSGTGRTAGGVPFSERIALPPGGKVVAMMTAGERLVIHVEVAGGPSVAYVVDPRSGALLGTIDFPPGIGR